MTTWPTKKLGEVTKIEGGGTPSTKNPLFWNGDVLWLTPKELSDFSDREIFDTERKITSEGLKHSKLFPAGAVLFTSRAPIGYVAIAGIQMATNQGFKNFICNEKILNNSFLYYFLKLKTKYLQSLGRGATFTEISRSILTKVEIPLPPLEIQKQIVERLDKIAEAQKLNDGLIQKTDELFQSLLHQELNPTNKDWGTKKLGEVIEISYGKGLSRDSRVDSGKYFAYGSNGPVYRTNESLTNGEIIVIGRKGTAGALYFISDPCWPIDTTFFAKPKNDVSLKFVYYLLQTKGLPRLAIVTGVPGINRTTLANVNVQLPPINTQKQIVAKLSAAQNYKTQLLAQKSKLKELFDSALARSMSNK